MNNIFKVALGATMLTAVTAMAAPKYPFPQNMKHPKGTIIEYANTDMIKEHFKIWKNAWYKDMGSEAWILAPEGTSSTVSEAIAYGMLIMVYMSDAQNDYQGEFDKLYATWKNHGGNGGGMDWRVGSGADTGSATDADVDAALALVMASKQWNKASYLEDAKTIINWIGTNDFNANNTLRPGNGWNDAFNPSYATLGHFTLFGKVTNDSKWETRRKQVASDLKACQNSSTGLVSDWCDWGSHLPTKTSASVAQSEDAGFFDDAARTPWRTAWAYYWYGDSDAKSFNDKIMNWLPDVSHGVASEINSGYYVDGRAEKSEKRNFASSTFSGGLGLAAASSDNPMPFFGTVYSYLASKTSCAKADGCGGSSVTGEKYYPSTLNLLYLLLMTGNMPNLYDMTGFAAFTPDPTKAPGKTELEGAQLVKGDSTVGLSGFWNWGAYHDKYNIGTTMNPDSGTSPLFYKNGAIYAEASMEIGPEPEWTAEAAAAGTLKYPSAGIAMAFLSNEKKGVDLKAMGITAVRVKMKASGPIRMAILNEITYQNEAAKKDNAGAGSEPGVYVPNTSDYVATTYSLTPCGVGFLGLASSCTNEADVKNRIDIIRSWVDSTAVPKGEQILTCVTGLKFELKQSEGGVGDFSIQSIEFLKGNEVVEPSKIAGFAVGTTPTNVVPTSSASGSSSSSSGNPGVVGGSSNSIGDPGLAIDSYAQFSMAKISASSMSITISGAQAGAGIAVFNMQGKVIATTKAFFGMAQTITVPNKGVYMVRVGNKMNKVVVK